MFFFSPRGFFTLQKNIPDAEWVDVGVMVNWLRTIKTPREIEFIRRAGKIVDKVMGVAVDTLKPGIRENDYAARIVQAQIEGDTEFGASYPCMIPFILPAHQPEAIAAGLISNGDAAGSCAAKPAPLLFGRPQSIRHDHGSAPFRRIVRLLLRTPERLLTELVEAMLERK
ncbi:hypothetical protein [Bradyrhizobium icense]|nr:hypothetical protein [Bradyrhizobium icense]